MQPRLSATKVARSDACRAAGSAALIAPQVTQATADRLTMQPLSSNKPAGETATARLVSASCTTGWLDWIHGELWLLPDGLLRVRSSLGATIAHANQQTVPDDLREREFGAGEIEELQRKHQTNLWIPAHEIVAASMRNGPLTTRLSLTLAGGRRVKLLWLRVDPAAVPLKRALASWGISV